MMKRCVNCKHRYKNKTVFPCNCCKHSVGGNDNRFESAFYSPKQPTTPPIPPVNPPKTGEEINHPTRYAGGKYECIDVMTDVFGVDAVKSFCKLNAFKYLWREKNKNGVEDLKKCAWYLDKLIELSGTDENV